MQSPPEDQTPPSPDQIEVSLFGPGIGESVVVHLGGGDWMVIDSCRRGARFLPDAAKYLGDIGVDLSSVKVIVASHWHDDHVKGIADLLKSCPSARFYGSQALGDREVKVMIELHGGEAPKAGGGSREIWDVLGFLEAQDRPLMRVGPNQTIFRRLASAEAPAAQVVSLSPSHAAIDRSINAMVSRIPKNGEERLFLPWLDANLNAIVLWVRVGTVELLLGADLEEVSDAIGWRAILSDPVRGPVNAEVFKVPHHGSMTSYAPEVWQKMLVARPYAVVTPNRSGSTNLPTREGQRAICSHTDRAYITHPRSGEQQEINRVQAVRKTIAEAGIRLHQRTLRPGQIRLRRKKPLDTTEPWELARFGAAEPLCRPA